ncbi:hypothetical protein PY98_13635, partial [Lacticaseibacillus rhamnosus]
AVHFTTCCRQRLKYQQPVPAATGKNTKQTAAAKTMPQAGEAQSPLAVLGLAILSMLGLAGFVSRKKRV